MFTNKFICEVGERDTFVDSSKNYSIFCTQDILQSITVEETIEHMTFFYISQMLETKTKTKTRVLKWKMKNME